jgi:hypothetical protein
MRIIWEIEENGKKWKSSLRQNRQFNKFQITKLPKTTQNNPRRWRVVSGKRLLFNAGAVL